MQIGWSSMHKAAENEDVEMLEYLLDQGANMDIRNKVSSDLVGQLYQ